MGLCFLGYRGTATLTTTAFERSAPYSVKVFAMWSRTLVISYVDPSPSIPEVATDFSSLVDYKSSVLARSSIGTDTTILCPDTFGFSVT